MPSLHVRSTPMTTAAMNSLPVTPPRSSAAARAAGTTETEGCRTAASCTSSKSLARPMTPLTNPASGAGTLSPWTRTWLSPRPAHPLTRLSTCRDSGEEEPAMITPKRSVTTFFAADTALSGISVGAVPATCSAISSAASMHSHPSRFYFLTHILRHKSKQDGDTYDR